MKRDRLYLLDGEELAYGVDDGSGKVEVNFDQYVGFVRNGQFVRTITRILPLMDGFECRGEAIQVLNNFDINLYRQVK